MYSHITVEYIPHLPDVTANALHLYENTFYSEIEKPVFFGHYWLKGNPSLYLNNICCLDHSVAKGGYLVAYQYDQEKQLNPDKFLYV